jgi:hypothetical protein
MVDGFILQPDIPDRYRWKLTQDGSYSSKSTYATFFVGSIKFGLWRRIWNTWAPPCSKFFIWLVAHNQVWAADRLARRNLPHPEFCPLCDLVHETINHLLVGCVFARLVWTTVGAAAVCTTAYCVSFLGVVEEIDCSCPQGSA